MKYTEFEDLISSARMRKYITACGNDTRKAMKLYRLNLKLLLRQPCRTNAQNHYESI
ncbi:MAG: hypothetical protein J6T60_02775 [Bacteroidales bacterium]|nr:hypothetical protein [Bacteroidales bacterium]